MTSTSTRATEAGNGSDAAEVVLRRLQALAPLSDAEIGIVRGLAALPMRQHAVRSELCTEGSACPPRFLASGWACRQRMLADGRRQIVSFLLPGDLITPVMRPRLRLSYAVVALTHVTTVDGTALADLANERDEPGSARSGIVRALRALDRVEEAMLHNQIVRLGRQTAYERLLHLLLELHDRLRVVGQADNGRFALPLTQEMLADTLGLSAVHMNRTLQQIRRDELLEFRSGSVVLLKRQLIEAAAEWQPLPKPLD